MMYDPTFEYDHAEDVAIRAETSDLLNRMPEIIQAARDFAHRFHEFQPDAPTLEAELNGLLKVLRGHDDPEQDAFIPGIPVMADELAYVIHVQNMDSPDAMIHFWRAK